MRDPSRQARRPAAPADAGGDPAPGASGVAARALALLRSGRASGPLALVDQGLVSGFGFLTGLLAARLVDLPSFGRFALVLIFTGFAQNLHNALITSPMMTLIGGRGGRPSPAYHGALVVAATLVSVAAGLLVAILVAAFFGLRGDGLPLRFILAVAALTAAQNILLTVRRLLFARGRGLPATLMDTIRFVAFPAALLGLRAAGVPVTVTLLTEGLALSAVLVSLPVLVATWPRRRRGLRVRAVFRRHIPLARWLMPVVLVTFGQEQLVWIVAGVLLGDQAVGGLRAAQYLVGLILLLLAAAENVIPVGAARAYASHGRAGLARYLVAVGGKLGLLLAIPVVVVAVPAAFWLKLVFGDAFAPFADCLRILALAALFVHVRDMATQYFRATRRTGVIFQAFAVSLVVSLVCLYPLLTGAGLVGAATVVLIGHAASMGTMLFAAVRARDPGPDRGVLVRPGRLALPSRR